MLFFRYLANDGIVEQVNIKYYNDCLIFINLCYFLQGAIRETLNL